MPTLESPPAKKTRSSQTKQPGDPIFRNTASRSRTFSRNLSPAQLYTEAIRGDEKCDIADTGALIAYLRRQNRPLARRTSASSNIPTSQDDVWWGTVNVPIDDETFEINRERAIDYLNTRKRLYVVDGFAGWDPQTTEPRSA